jgi:hypothetical protein
LVSLRHHPNLPITAEDVRKLGKDSELAVKFPEEYGLGVDVYISQLDIFHQIGMDDLSLKPSNPLVFISLKLIPLDSAIVGVLLRHSRLFLLTHLFPPNCFDGKYRPPELSDCLNLLRHLAWAEYDCDEKYGKKPFPDLHWIQVSHCTDILMQNLMCPGNMNVLTFNVSPPPPPKHPCLSQPQRLKCLATPMPKIALGNYCAC